MPLYDYSDHRRLLGADLKTLRKQQPKTVYRIWKETGLTYRQIGGIEGGTKNYTIDSLLAYAFCIGLKPMQLAQLIARL